MPEQRVKAVNFDICKKALNELVTIATSLQLAYRKTNESFIIFTFITSNDESTVKIGPKIAEICQFLSSFFAQFLQKFHKLPS